MPVVGDAGSAPEPDQLIVTHEDRVATLTLNRPQRSNALSPGLQTALRTTLTELEEGDDVRVIRIAARGRAFCSGYDIGGSAVPTAASADVSGATPLSELGQSRIAIDRRRLRSMVDGWMWIWSYSKPVVAQVHGPCLAGGLDLLGACDLVFAGASATFGHPGSRALGIPVTLGMLPLRIGAARTKQLLFTGDVLDAAAAHDLGMVEEVVADDQLDGVTMAFCRRIAQMPLDALTVHKHVVNRWSELMGARTGAYEGADYDAMFHETPATAAFSAVARAEGLRAALRWRDGAFDAPSADLAR